MNFPNYHPFFLLTPMERRYYLMWVTHYDVLEFFARFAITLYGFGITLCRFGITLGGFRITLCGLRITLYGFRIALRGFGIKLRYVVLELHNVITLKLRYVVQYQRSLTTYLRDRPKKKKDYLLMRKGTVAHAMVRLVEPINGTCYSRKF